MLDAAVAPIKARAPALGGELLVGLAAAQLAGEKFLAGFAAIRKGADGRQGRVSDRVQNPRREQQRPRRDCRVTQSRVFHTP